MRHRPLLIGVVGGSGSGKTTVARAIYDFLGRDAAFIDQDAYYLDLSHLSLDERRLVNFDHPDAFDTDLMVGQLRQLQAWQPIRKPTYDFAAHTRAEAVVEVAPRDVVLVDGILLFADALLRSLFDIKIFVDVADDVRFIRRLQRDVEERGRTMENVIRQYLSRTTSPRSSSPGGGTFPSRGKCPIIWEGHRSSVRSGARNSRTSRS